MRLCIIGRHGQLATALAEEAARSGVETRQLGRPECDLAQDIDLPGLLQGWTPDIVINAAAYTAVDAAEHDEATAHCVNATGPHRLAQATAALDIPLIHVSTDYVFDGLKATPYTEEDCPHPTSVYGRTKLEGERLVAAANPRHAILRTAWVYSHTGQNFVRTMMRLASRGEVPVVSDQFGCPTYAPDLARASLAVARNLCAAQPGDPRFGLFILRAGAIQAGRALRRLSSMAWRRPAHPPSPARFRRWTSRPRCADRQIHG